MSPMRPLRPCLHPSCTELVVSGYCDKHQPIRTYDKYRGTSTERGYDARHRAIREIVRREEPLCRECLKTGKLTPSNEMDHIDGNVRNIERINLQMLCKRHHSRKTIREQGGYNRFNIKNIKPSGIPLIMICGAPGSGKTAFVDKYKNPGDIIIDLDYIKAEISGEPLYHSSNEWILRALAQRNEILKSLYNKTEGQAWFIVSAPTRKERALWRDILQPKRVIIMQTDEYTCIRRIQEDNRRKDISNTFAEAIKKWWKLYQFDERDEIIRWMG